MLTLRSAAILTSVVLLFLAAFNVPSQTRVNLGWLGLALFVLSTILTV